MKEWRLQLTRLLIYVIFVTAGLTLLHTIRSDVIQYIIELPEFDIRTSGPLRADKSLPTCEEPIYPGIWTNVTLPVNLITTRNGIEPGGAWRPVSCTARARVLVVVAYRDRSEHLNLFLTRVHHVLQKQQLDYRILVSEQTDEGAFNKGVLYNTAILQAQYYLTNGSATYPYYNCVVLHDIDTLPEYDNISYACEGGRVRRLSTYLDRYHYNGQPGYGGVTIGGVSSMPFQWYQRANGHSNMYFGWGGEDDDFACRLRNKKLYWKNTELPWYRWSSLPHGRRNRERQYAPRRHDLLHKCIERQEFDGLCDVSKYMQVIKWEYTPLYTLSLIKLTKAADQVVPQYLTDGVTPT